ncbi:MAG TPA: HDOD domain-containing protein [Opitutaceae bacterium]|nr:HDOD domain-containing protein [Opitutaceae bacterium]
MSTLESPARSKTAYSEREVRRRISDCPKLASLQSVNKALGELVRSEQSLNSQIAEIIRRDPSLSARLLRMVNSVYFGFSATISSIEEAVFFLGLRRIRELSMATPVIEEMQNLHLPTAAQLPWKGLWAHSIGSAILTREVLSGISISVDDDTDYLAGLLHNVGKVVMAYAFPCEFLQIAATPVKDSIAVCALEREIIGWDHAQIGAHFLELHKVSDEIVNAVRFHHEPDRAPSHRLFAAGVQVADCLVRHAGVAGGFEQVATPSSDSWQQLEGWHILYGADVTESKLGRASIANALQRLPCMLSGLL